MKLNLGCGANKRDGYINVDKWAGCLPDRLIDLEQTPWMDLPAPGEKPSAHHWRYSFEESSVDEILMIHVLEHLGFYPDTFLRIMKELYRVCAPDATVLIAVPHPRHDDFIGDPTHVRPVTPNMLSLFSKKNCDAWEKQGASNSRFAHQLGVDFEIIGVEEILDPKEIGAHPDASRLYSNVIKEYRIALKVCK